MNTLAIDVGGSKLTMAAFSNGRMIAKESKQTDRAGGRDWMLDQITSLGRQWKKAFPFDRCGIGFGGPVSYDLQRVALSTHVGGWQDFHLPNYVRNLLDINDAIMDNDANVGALGEFCHGAARGWSNIFYMTLSTGIGGGIVIENQIYRGADSYAGEIGHLTIRPDGPDCLCGARGCFERMCAGLWLERDHGRTAQELLSDPDFVNKYVVDLSLGLKACLMLLNPELVVIGGGMSKAGDALFLPLREELGRQMTPWSKARVEVVPAELGDDSVLWGALTMAEQL